MPGSRIRTKNKRSKLIRANVCLPNYIIKPIFSYSVVSSLLLLTTGQKKRNTKFVSLSFRNTVFLSVHALVCESYKLHVAVFPSNQLSVLPNIFILLRYWSKTKLIRNIINSLVKYEGQIIKIWSKIHHEN